MKLLKLALILEQDHLVVSLWSFGLKGWRISRSEKVSLPTSDPLADQVLSAMRPLILKWGLPPDIPLIAVAPPGVGGFLSFSFPRVAKKDLDALVDQELSKALPYSLREVERGFQAKRAGDRLEVSLFWLPKPWVNELRNALSRSGIRLSEVFHRAQQLGVALKGRNPAAPWGCIEQQGARVQLHFYRQGALPDRSRQITCDTPVALAGELDVDLLALANSGIKPAVVHGLGLEEPLRSALAQTKSVKLQFHKNESNPNQLLLALWNGGGKGVWLAPDKALMSARLTPLLIAAVMVVLVFSATGWWILSGLRDQADALESEAKRLKPRHAKVLAIEKEVLRTQQELNQIAALANAPSPLEPLYEVYKVLPQTAWLVRFNYISGQVEIEGYGIDNRKLMEMLQSNRKFSEVSPIEPQLAKNVKRLPFAVKLKWMGRQ
ncbi:MAG: PilN domain-containing protein [Sulfuricellaceae bacterium]